MGNARTRIRSACAALVALVAGLLAGVAVLTPTANAAGDELVPTTTVLTISGGRTYGDTMRLTAMVRSTGRPTGAVQFGLRPSLFADPVPMGAPVPLDLLGRATYSFEPEPGLASYTATFVGTGRFAGSSDEELTATAASGVRLVGRGTLSAGLRRSLTPSAFARHLGSGRPAEGVELTFTAGGRLPNLFDSGGGDLVCTAVTDHRGFASCGADGVRPAAFWRSTKAYVAASRDGRYAFAAAVLPRHSLR